MRQAADVISRSLHVRCCCASCRRWRRYRQEELDYTLFHHHLPRANKVRVAHSLRIFIYSDTRVLAPVLLNLWANGEVALCIEVLLPSSVPTLG